MKSTFLFALSLAAITARAQDTLKHAVLADTSTNSKVDDYEKTFTKVEIEAAYPGGLPAWQKFLIKNLHYPDDAINNKIQGTVIVQFIVDTEGNISSVAAVSGPLKGGLREEAVRIIKISGKWVPAVQNGHQVKSYKKQPLVFKLSVQ
jgi:periplasmic protein TonB